LVKSLEGVNEHSPRLFWKSSYPPGSPRHEDCQYAFKYYAFKEAVRQGFIELLWLDAGMTALKPLQAIWDLVAHEGYFFIPNGYSLGNWCSDTALRVLGLSREEAFDVPLISGSVFGLNMRNTTAKRIYKNWGFYTAAGAMNGAHINALVAEKVVPILGARPIGPVSSDSRVFGHRHDESVLSVWVLRESLTLSPGELCSPPGEQQASTVLIGRGVRPRQVR
jgi:hypothetical protein